MTSTELIPKPLVVMINHPGISAALDELASDHVDVNLGTRGLYGIDPYLVLTFMYGRAILSPDFGNNQQELVENLYGQTEVFLYPVEGPTTGLQWPHGSSGGSVKWKERLVRFSTRTAPRLNQVVEPIARVLPNGYTVSEVYPHHGDCLMVCLEDNNGY